jgi:phosphatidate cytidylyltransferase
LNNFLQRTITGILFVAVIIGSVWWGPSTFQLLFLVISVFSLLEFYRLIESSGRQPFTSVGIATGILTYILISGNACGHFSNVWLVLLLPAGAIIFFSELYRKKDNPFINVALTFIGIIYALVPFALLTSLSYQPGFYHRGLLIGYFLLLWSSDTFAYIWGSLFGRHRLFERISPKKSWEGSIMGTLTTLLLAWLLSRFYEEIALQHWLVITLIICITGTLGDLTESLLKDSGNILPGHGGILDRFDALLLSVPFVIAYLVLFL